MYASISPVAGTQPWNDWFAPDTVQRHPLGLRVSGVDPFWGLGTFIYVKGGTSVAKGSACFWDDSYALTLLPNTASQGFCFGIAMTPLTATQYGWLQVEGLSIFATSGAAVAAGAALGVNGAGTLGTYTTLKGVIGMRVTRASSYAPTFANVRKVNGTNTLFFPNGYDGMFLGLSLSGTGIPASTVVAALDGDGKRVYMGTSVGTADKLATDSATVTVTGTYTGFGSAMINNPTCMAAVA